MHYNPKSHDCYEAKYPRADVNQFRGMKGNIVIDLVNSDKLTYELYWMQNIYFIQDKKAMIRSFRAPFIGK